MKGIFFALLAVCCYFPQIRCQEIADERIIEIERLAEETLATDPYAKSFSGLMQAFKPSTDVLKEVGSINITDLTSLARRNKYGIAILAIADGQARGVLTHSEVMRLSLEVVQHLPVKAIELEEVNPIITYWEAFDEWDGFIENLPQIASLCDAKVIFPHIFYRMSSSVRSKIIDSEHFHLFSTETQSFLLREAMANGTVNLLDPKWENPLVKYYNEGGLPGGLLYFNYSQQRGSDYRQRLMEFIIKFQNDYSTLALLSMYARAELRKVNVTGFPISDKAKSILSSAAKESKESKSTR